MNKPIICFNEKLHLKKKLYFVRMAIVLVGMFAMLLPFASSTAQAQSRTHTVASGETLARIAINYGVDSTQLAYANNITDRYAANVISIGQQLVIPGGGVTESSVVSRPESVASVVVPTVAPTAIPAVAVAAAPVTQQASAVASASFPSTTPTYVVRSGDTLASIGAMHGITGYSIMVANGLTDINRIWPGQELMISDSAGVAASASPAVQAPAAGKKVIEVNLSNQTLTAWEGNTSVLHTSISSGTYETPTVVGRFPVYWKLASQHMWGDDFSLPGVPSVMYFHQGYAVHGAYWHNNFGTPMSHGCVNMIPEQADFLFSWAPVGTEVYVHY